MKLAFICHRWRGDKKYEKQTRQVCYDLVMEGNVIPVSTALMFNSFLDDKNIHERQAGISDGLALLKLCGVLYLYDNDGLSEGMKIEIKTARLHEIPIEVKNEK